ncbi:hypothetical protein NUITMVRE18_27610 [Enterococcus faecium]|nr:hypothetical protein HMPREF1372_00175 [Enterococcus faecium P1139]GMR85894.1 hypothetical protein NUITMVRE14_27280 [Enterococcus faecium]GMR91666.1 hypothetical protein NUITMVRE16_27600 [Enterococcus faecium]GMR94483.1 hypothetical protein NUITMVRE17_27580 [Enterococcus faecium]GMR97301.1 hypothetical protein NUITMVRE18_27610 [Enterococcus faecium]
MFFGFGVYELGGGGGDYDTPLIGHWSLVDSCLALLSQGFQRFFLTKSVMPRV